VLAQRDPNSINMLEILMYIWITAFAYDELSGITDAGMLFYQLDFWSLWNVGIIGVGIAFLVCRESFFELKSALAELWTPPGSWKHSAFWSGKVHLSHCHRYHWSGQTE
jgi:hypothetical protein